MSDLHVKLRQLRDFCGYSQEVVAFHLHIAQPTYCEMESGKTRLTIDRLDQIAPFFGISSSDLMSKSIKELIEITIDNQHINKKRGGVNRYFFKAQSQSIDWLCEHLRVAAFYTSAYAAGLAVGYWKNLDDLRQNWGIAHTYEPTMENAKREKLMRGWQKAIERSFGWEE